MKERKKKLKESSMKKPKEKKTKFENIFKLAAVKIEQGKETHTVLCTKRNGVIQDCMNADRVCTSQCVSFYYDGVEQAILLNCQVRPVTLDLLEPAERVKRNEQRKKELEDAEKKRVKGKNTGKGKIDKDKVIDLDTSKKKEK